MSEPENNSFQEDLRGDSYEGEAAVLGSMILDPGTIGMLAATLTPDSFHRPENRLLYENIAEVYLDKGNVDLVMLRDALKKKGLLEEVGGVKYLVEIMESVPSAANAKHYSGMIKDAYHERKLQKIIADIEDIAGDLKPLPERVAAIQEAAMSIELADDGKGDLVDFSKHIGSVVDNIRGENDFIRTGIGPLDDRILGFLPGELVIVAGRPRMGKSALASQWAISMAKSGIGVLYESFEMSTQSLMERILSSEASVDLHEFTKWRSEHDAQALKMAGDELARKKLNIIFDSTATTPAALAVAVKRLKKTHRIRVVFVDYLQLMGSGTRTSNLREKITEISRKLKLLAIAEDISVITLSQLNRDVEGRTTHVPRLSDLRESGSIEQDADMVLLLNRPELYGGEADGKANVHIAKSRRGPGGVVALDFAARYTRFGGGHEQAQKTERKPDDRL